MSGLSRAERAERDDYIAKRTKAGFSASQIAAELGVTTRTVERARKRTGVGKFCPTALTDTELRLAAALLDDGASYGEVARTLHRNLETIRRRFPGRSIWKQADGNTIRQYNETLNAIQFKGTA